MQTFVPKRDPENPNEIVLIPQNEGDTWGGGFEYSKNRKVYFEAGLHYNQNLASMRPQPSCSITKANIMLLVWLTMCPMPTKVSWGV